MSADNFWPEDIASSKFDVGKFLKDVAVGLQKNTNGELSAEIEFSAAPGVFVYTMQIRPRGWPDYSFELLTVKTKDGGLPAVISTTHTEKRDFKVNNEEQINSYMKRVLRDPSTVRILKTIKDEMASPNMIYNQSDFNIHEESVEEIKRKNFDLSYSGFMQDGERFAAIDLYGVGGFLSFSEIKRLTLDAGEAGSAYTNTPDGRVMIDIKFASSIRCFLTMPEANGLRLAASQLLLRDKDL